MLFCFFLLLFSLDFDTQDPKPRIDIDSLILELEDQIGARVCQYRTTVSDINLRILGLEDQLRNTSYNAQHRIDVLLKIRDQERELLDAKSVYDIENTFFRYRKGIEVLKMIYEKVLSLDHHFSSLDSYQEISNMSNPNSYAEFVKLKDEIKNSTKSRNKIDVPELLDNNSIFSMGYALIYSFFGSAPKHKRELQLNKISCLLDFSLSMHSDLKIILYETDYLREHNESLKKATHDMFDDYTQILGYGYGLEYCRSEDNWELLNIGLDNLLNELKNRNAYQVDELKELTQLRFSIDRLIELMDRYDQFVYQSEMYYHKFLSIVESYHNRELCNSSLPPQFESLSVEIELSIDKFESAYKIAELKGSRLRELLYGFEHDR